MFKCILAAVAIISHEPGYYTSLAKHIQRWLKEEKIVASVSSPDKMKGSLACSDIAFLVGFSNPSASEIKELEKFRSRGGKMVVFHSASPALARMMGVRPVGYKSASYPGQWSKMVFSAKFPEGLPSSVRQTSSVLQCARAIEGKSRVIAKWSDRSGKMTEEPAWIASASGFWMTHVLSADGDEDLKARLCASLVGAVKPGLWNYGEHSRRKADEKAAMRSYALRQVPRRGEIHAVWDHSGCGLYAGDWPRTMKVLESSRVTDIFVNVAGAGFAHYESSVLPQSKIFSQEGDQLSSAIAAAEKSGIRVHAWMLAFSATRSTPDRLETFRRRGWRLKNRSGRLTEYLDPANPQVREYVLSAIAEIQSKYPVAGIHLDFVRWADGAVKPVNAADILSGFMVSARRKVKRPRWLTAAVYGKYPACIASVGQDWASWVDMNVVDYIVPMDYTESPAVFDELLRQQASGGNRARKTIVGIGVTANESRLDALKVIDQINMSRRYGFAGNALFDLDITLEKQILPYLRLGIW